MAERSYTFNGMMYSDAGVSFGRTVFDDTAINNAYNSIEIAGSEVILMTLDMAPVDGGGAEQMMVHVNQHGRNRPFKLPMPQPFGHDVLNAAGQSDQLEHRRDTRQHPGNHHHRDIFRLRAHWKVAADRVILQHWHRRQIVPGDGRPRHRYPDRSERLEFLPAIPRHKRHQSNGVRQPYAAGAIRPVNRIGFQVAGFQDIIPF